MAESRLRDVIETSLEAKKDDDDDKKGKKGEKETTITIHYDDEEGEYTTQEITGETLKDTVESAITDVNNFLKEEKVKIKYLSLD